MVKSDLDNKIIIYTDGSSSGNPGPGGWAAVIVKKKETIEIGGGEKNTTNNRMELRAVIEALNHVYKLPARNAPANICEVVAGAGGTAKNLPRGKALRGHKLILHTDAEYILKGITQWARQWQKNGWRTKARKPVLNQDLWQELIKVTAALESVGNKIEWKLVPAHAGVALNERCDKIAVAFSLGGHPDLFRGILTNYQKFSGYHIVL